MQDELDRGLQSLFREQSRHLPEEPFLSDTLRLIKKHRAQRVIEQNLLLLLAVIACALSSRYIIKCSISLSGYLDSIFKTAELFMERPLGLLSVALCGAVLILIFRRRIISAFA